MKPLYNILEGILSGNDISQKLDNALTEMIRPKWEDYFGELKSFDGNVLTMAVNSRNNVLTKSLNYFADQFKAKQILIQANRFASYLILGDITLPITVETNRSDFTLFVYKCEFVYKDINIPRGGVDIQTDSFSMEIEGCNINADDIFIYAARGVEFKYNPSIKSHRLTISLSFHHFESNPFIKFLINAYDGKNCVEFKSIEEWNVDKLKGFDPAKLLKLKQLNTEQLQFVTTIGGMIRSGFFFVKKKSKLDVKDPSLGSQSGIWIEIPGSDWKFTNIIDYVMHDKCR